MIQNTRVFSILALIFGVGLIFLVKLFFLQVVDKKYSELANRNVVKKIVEYPSRGILYDRNGELLVFNLPEYDLMLIHGEMASLDSLKFCQLIDINKEELQSLFSVFLNRREYSKHLPVLFMSKLSTQDIAVFQDKLDDFPGFYIQPRTTRGYATLGAANTLGYVSEISSRQLERDTTGFYRSGYYIGQTGIEAYYETQLRGTPGVRFELRDVKGVDKGSFENHRFDTASTPGLDLFTTIDISLQEYGEYLMQGKVGSILCLEPATGEVLASVSAPSYNPLLLSGKNFSSYYQTISQDSLKPLFNRPLMAQYRPGSIFKIAQSLVGLQEQVVDNDTRIRCNRNIIGCHGPHSYEDLMGAVAFSCNPYFYIVFKRMMIRPDVSNEIESTRKELDRWNQNMQSFGFGHHLGIDLFDEKTGLLPTTNYYDRAYNFRTWGFSNIYSIAIGEGENLVTPLQMANFAATIANKGYYYIPHVVKSIGKEKSILPRFQYRHYTVIDSTHFNTAREAMKQVVESGTGQYRAKLRNIVVAGKTGTVQNGFKKKDHSVFIAFAPYDNPRIALSVYVENAGEGSRAAAAIAGLMIEKYLLGKTERPQMEEYVLANNFK